VLQTSLSMAADMGCLFGCRLLCNKATVPRCNEMDTLCNIIYDPLEFLCHDFELRNSCILSCIADTVYLLRVGSAPVLSNLSNTVFKS
jgi:hypothetical protein